MSDAIFKRLRIKKENKSGWLKRGGDMLNEMDRAKIFRFGLHSSTFVLQIWAQTKSKEYLVRCVVNPLSS